MFSMFNYLPLQDKNVKKILILKKKSKIIQILNGDRVGRAQMLRILEASKGFCLET